ncbi:MAG: outer membrane protein assembly factor [Betaproteobacteria bacterium]|nr:MAG: outer membrane protein assembly factor [Betaproteobacteria bacterium]TMH36566.1 MAG: outer membrane protein assembly factor [Betaproteobacteria bacterium]
MNWRSPAVAALVVLQASLLAGCASGLFSGKKTNEVDAAKPAASAPERAVYALDVQAPKELRALLVDYLDLSRFQNAPETDSITPAELDRLVAAAPAQARGLLETEGYFNADVQVSRALTDSGTPLLRVHVAPGPRAIVEAITLDATGELRKGVDASERAAVDELASLRRQWALSAGKPFRQVAWNDAKNTTIARLRAEGYPSAAWSITSAQVDALNNTVRLHVVADSGPLFHVGEIRIDGLQRYDEQSVRRLANFRVGEPYSEKVLLDFQERLQKVGLFEGSVVEIDPNPDTAAAAPVLVHLKELPLQTATVGVGYSANTGPRLTLEHLHRRVFGTRWMAKNKFELGPSLKSWQGDLTSHPLAGLYRNLIGGSAERLRSADQLRTSWSARVGRTQDTPRIERLYYAELAHSRLETAAGTNSSDAVSGNYHWIWRDVDSVLLPTKGVTLATQVALGLAHGRQITEDGITEGRGPFTRAWGRLTWYRPLGGSWYATTRVEAGQIFARDRVPVPDTLLFRAGGDESVRGYAYRTLGPVIDGVVTSGRVLMTGSAELARPIAPKWPAYWWAMFVDAGDAANRWGDLRPALGYGVGFRWRSPVGPLRIDWAYGQRVHKMRLHLSVGISF